MGANELLLVAGAGQALAGGANAFTQSSALRSQGRFQSRMLSENARISETLADDALARGQESETRYLQDLRQLQGRQRAVGWQGVELSSGTPADIMRETTQFGLEDAKTIRVNALREAFGYKQQGAMLNLQAQMVRRSSRNAARSTLLAGGLGVARNLATTASLYAALQPPKPNLTFTEEDAEEVVEQRPFPPIGAIGGRR